MPKRTGPKPPRAHTTPSADTRVRRPGRPAPRPSATVPVGMAAPAAESYREMPSPGPATPAQRPTTAAGRLYRPARASTLPLIVDYGYVVSDLKRIALLAGVAFAVLIGLTFVVH